MRSIPLFFIALLTMTTLAQQHTPPPTVDVTGEGKVTIIPDQASIRVRVEHEGKEASKVKTQIDTAIDAVIRFLRAQNIRDTDIQTEYINLNKNYNYNTKTYMYTGNQALTVKLKELANYETVMSGLISSGINRIDGVQLASSQADALRDQARVKAMEDAKKRARLYAQAVGQSIGKAVHISEQSGVYPQPRPYAVRSFALEAAADVPGETLAPGELSITVKVAVSFELQ